MYRIVKENYNGDGVEIEKEFATLAEAVYYLAQHEPIDYISELITPEGEHISLA